MTAPRARMRTAHATIGDLRTTWDEDGPAVADDVLVLLHGFPHSRAFWAPQLGAAPGALAARLPGWRIVAPDLRGFGDTDARGPYSMDRYADDVAALLDHLGVARAAVAGLSMGGYVALALWRRHRARVRALVLADTRAGADAPAARERRRELVTVAREAGSAAVAESQLDGALGATSRRDRPEVVAGLRALMAAAPAEGIVGALEAMMDRPDSTSTLATIDVPTLVIVGAEDVLTRPAEARALRDGIPGARLVEIDGAGHVASWERPEPFGAAVAGFLGTP